MALLAATVRAQAVSGDDPANLKGERVRAVEGEPLEVDRGAKGVAGLLKKLNTRASLLMIVAHPDDEDGGMLTYESRGVGARVGMLTLTRGEGGQNVVSGDFNDALGLVRTRELLAADQYLGVDQMFGTEVDFGFSKTKEEAFSQWTHERVLYDAVRAVRLYRPLVVTSVFLGAPTDGHGQHQVSGEIAQEVFNAAADPKVFPEMGLPVWAPAKVYARVPFSQVSAGGMFDYATGKTVPTRFENYVTGTVSNAGPQATVMVPEGEASSLLGASYVQFARMGLALQKTQIGGGVRLAPAGRFDVGYTRYGSRVAPKNQEDGFFDGVDVSLMGIAALAPSLRGADANGLRDGLERLQNDVHAATQAFNMEHPEAAAPGLRQALRELDGLIARTEMVKDGSATERYNVLHELRVKRVQANEALVQALGLELRAACIRAAPVHLSDGRHHWSSGPLPHVASPGEELEVEVSLTNKSNQSFRVHDETAASAAGVTIKALKDLSQGSERVVRSLDGQRITAVLANDAPYSRPYFTRKNVEQPFYDLLDEKLRNAPTIPPALTVWEVIDWQDVSLRMGAVVNVRSQRGLTAHALEPLRIVPPVSIALQPMVAVLPEGQQQLHLALEPRSEQRGSAVGTAQVECPKGWTVSPSTDTFQAPGGGETRNLPVSVAVHALGTTEKTITAVAESSGKEYREGYHAVGYPGITNDDLYQAAATRVRGVDVKVPAGLKVAYLPGTGDAVEEAFGQIGIAVTRVSVADIAAGRLAGYDALVMGVRAYAAHKDLAGVTAQVTAFARAGGAVVVQYNTAEYSGADAPYSLSLGSAEKVVEESAAVRLLAPKSQVLLWPNKLTEHDFDGWVEERGHGFMGEWDSRFAAVTEVHDAGQDPQRGGLLVAPVGEGVYVYCAYALYRQLPEGVPGAFRLLANLVSLGRRPETGAGRQGSEMHPTR